MRGNEKARERDRQAKESKRGAKHRLAISITKYFLKDGKLMEG